MTVTVLLVPPASSLSTSFPSSTTGTFTLNWTAASHSTRYQLNQSLNGGSAPAVYNSTGLSFTTNQPPSNRQVAPNQIQYPAAEPAG